MPNFDIKTNAKRDAFGSKFVSFFQKKRGKESKSAAGLGNTFGGYYSSYVSAPGKPVWSGREYGKFSDEGYIKNVIAHRSIKLISTGAAGISFKLHRIEGNNKFEIKEHKLLRLLNQPSPLSSGRELFESLYSYKLISGNAYLQVIKNGNDMPEELFALRPDRVTIIAGNNCLPRSYRYSLGDKYKDFHVDILSGQSDILHLKNFHPLNDWYGLSAIEAAAYSIDQHNQAGQWNQALLQNGARPSGALVFKGDSGNAYLTEDQFSRMKNQIDEAHSGAANAGRPMLLEGGLEWREMSLSPKDMDFINAKNSSARDIALAFGVPPQLLGIPGDNTYSNLAEARLSLWEQTIIPLVDNMVGALNNWLAPMFPGNLRISYNKDKISALIPRREELWKRVTEADFLSDSEKREMLGVK